MDFLCSIIRKMVIFIEGLQECFGMVFFVGNTDYAFIHKLMHKIETL